MFCLAAVFCGLFIGGCAGFAAEAVSSIMITATWGPQKRQTKSKMDFVEEELLGRISTSSSNCSKVESVEEDLLDRISTSSLGNRLFGDSTDEQSSSMPSIRKESVTTARASSSPVLIRRMRLSSTPNIRKSSWDWEAGDDQTGKKTL